jgi:D-alanyl-lipoteichoic acid acyltransferase DltB (MBOAT superfamily)
MLFNSPEFALFLPIVFLLYWFVTNRNLKLQNALILAASYLFYGWWDFRFLSLIIVSTLTDYVTGIKIHGSSVREGKKLWLAVSIIINLGLLGFFKYFNFFVDSFISLFGLDPAFCTIHIILPVGISFYTFQTMSYSIDIYRGRVGPTRDFITFAAFVSFFPQLVAGPIERAANLLPQFQKQRTFSYANGILGFRQIIYGLFKKIVIADSLAPVVNEIFANYREYSGGTLFLGAIYFSFQIYCDFSGYSDIAIGTGRLFGFNLMTNFKFPYFSRNIAEFWRRWHISLTSWFRDYVYIPLGGSRTGKWKGVRNVFAVFLVSGLWHGANWTFIIWGIIHAFLFLPLYIMGTNRDSNRNQRPDSFMEITKIICGTLVTFTFVSLTWVFFRAPDLSQACTYLLRIFKETGLPADLIWKSKIVYYVIPFILLDYGVMRRPKVPPWLLWVLVFIAVELIRSHSFAAVTQKFIYFDF